MELRRRDRQHHASPTHGYTASGTYYVSLTVTDNKGTTHTTTQPVTVTVIPPNVNPMADFTFSCIDRSCMFDSSGSVDPDGGTIALYAWTFGNGGTWTTPIRLRSTRPMAPIA